MLGREKEISFLESLYGRNTLQFVMLQGTEDSGKTTMLKEFFKHKRKAYFVFRNSTDELNKAAFSLEMNNQGFGKNGDFFWQDNLREIVKTSTGEKIILVLDDVQELNSRYHEFLPQLKKLLLEIEQEKRLLIIFSGTNLEYVKKELVNYQSIIYELQLNPLRYHEVSSYLHNVDNEDKVVLYGITNGNPKYVYYLEQQNNLKENLKKLFFNDDSILLKFGETKLGNSFRQPSIYHAILCSVACGAVHMKDIAEAVNIPANKVSKYISVLLETGYLEKIVLAKDTLVVKQSKNTCYKIRNHTLLFWYKFVYPYMSMITIGMGNFVLKNKVLPFLEDYSKEVFLDICYQHCLLLKERKDFSIEFTKLGFTWFNIKEDNEIYLQAFDDRNNVCHIKVLWNKNKTDIVSVHEFQNKFYDSRYKENYYLIFSRKSFSDKLLAEAAKNTSLRLISLRYLK